MLPSIPGLEEVEPVTSDTVWDLDVLPSRLAVLGGGNIGCELGQALARLGSEVTIVEGAECILTAGCLEAYMLGAPEGRARTVHAGRTLMDGTLALEAFTGRGLRVPGSG